MKEYQKEKRNKKIVQKYMNDDLVEFAREETKNVVIS
jgi:hypothetical protein